MIDLHTHSNKSDGSLSPTQLINLASKMGLRAIALTDHDTCSGWEEAQAAATQCGITFIRGIELGMICLSQEVHLLAYHLTNIDELTVGLAYLAVARRKRNEKIFTLIRKAGHNICLEDLHAGKPEVSQSLGRPHIAQLLQKLSLVATKQEAFDKYLARGKPWFVAREMWDMKEAIGIIKRAGGVSVVAHPLLLNKNWAELDSLMDLWKSSGIDGIEAYHPSGKLGQCRRLEKMAKEKKLLVTAGSDFHGVARPERRLGHSTGNVVIEDSFLTGISTLR